MSKHEPSTGKGASEDVRRSSLQWIYGTTGAIVGASAVVVSLIAFGISLDEIMTAITTQAEITTANPSEAAAMRGELEATKDRVRNLQAQLEEASETIRQQASELTAAEPNGGSREEPGAGSSPRADNPSTGGPLTMTAGEGFDFEEVLVLPEETVGVDIYVANSASEQLNSDYAGVVAVGSRDFPGERECADALEGTDDLDYFSEYEDGTFICTQTDQGSIAALHIVDVTEIAGSNHIDFDFRLYD